MVESPGSFPANAATSKIVDLIQPTLTALTNYQDRMARLLFEISCLEGLDELAATEKRGYAQRAAGYWPQSSDYGSEPMDIAVPILVQRRPVGCLSLVWPAERHAAHDIATAHLAAMRATALAIERAVRA